MITVYCDGDTGQHADRRWICDQFAETDGVWNPVREMPDGRKQKGKSYQMLRGDRPTGSRATGDDLRSAELRGRYAFDCKMCGLSVRALSSTFRPILATLHRAGLTEISLTALQKRLAND